MSNNRRREARKSAARRKKRDINTDKLLREISGFLVALLIVIVLAYSIVTFFVQSMTVVGRSMEPTLITNDVCLVNKMAYRFTTVKRYDVIAYKYRDDDGYFEIKRVVGLPGETITIEDGKLYVDGKELRDYPVETYILSAGLCEQGVTLDNDEYFVIGDNVNNSEDSRFANAGNVMTAEIKGKVLYRISPFKEKGKVR